MQIALQPIIPRDSDAVPIEKELRHWFLDVVYQPIYDLLESEVSRQNYIGISYSAITEALESGVIHYNGTVFYGKFNSKISKEMQFIGAKYNKVLNGYAIKQGDIPYELRGKISESKQKSKETHKKLLALLGLIFTNLKEVKELGLLFDKPVESIVGTTHQAIVRDLKNLEITEETEFSEHVRQDIRIKVTDKLHQNLEDKLKNYTLDHVESLHKAVENNMDEGRLDKLEGIIKAHNGKANRMANTMAIQETNLLIANYVQEQADALGSPGYIWHTVLDNRVRHDHKLLEKRQFSWDNPPIVDRETGRRGHPGEDYNCRCAARILVALNKTLNAA
jgi:SPP1 gp7 family putative phage head morphogenesis protein